MHPVATALIASIPEEEGVIRVLNQKTNMDPTRQQVCLHRNDPRDSRRSMAALTIAMPSTPGYIQRHFWLADEIEYYIYQNKYLRDTCC